MTGSALKRRPVKVTQCHSRGNVLREKCMVEADDPPGYGGMPTAGLTRGSPCPPRVYGDSSPINFPGSTYSVHISSYK